MPSVRRRRLATRRYLGLSSSVRRPLAVASRPQRLSQLLHEGIDIRHRGVTNTGTYPFSVCRPRRTVRICAHRQDSHHGNLEIMDAQAKETTRAAIEPAPRTKPVRLAVFLAGAAACLLLPRWRFDRYEMVTGLERETVLTGDFLPDPLANVGYRGHRLRTASAACASSRSLMALGKRPLKRRCSPARCS